MDREYRPAWRDRLRVRARRKLLARLRTLLQPEGTCLLDLGGGTGVTTVTFGKGARDIVVLEPNERRISRGRAAGAPVTFVPGVAESVPYPDGRFDRVVSLLSFHHFSRGDDALREAARVLAPGGRLVVYDLNPSSLSARWLGLALGHHPDRFASSTHLTQRALAAGFRTAHAEPFRSGTFVVADR